MISLCLSRVISPRWATVIPTYYKITIIRIILLALRPSSCTLEKSASEAYAHVTLRTVLHIEGAH